MAPPKAAPKRTAKKASTAVKRTLKKAAKKTVKKTTKKAAKKSSLSKKQVAQRKYASAMRGVRKRATGAKGGKGKIAKRGAATKLRRKLGLKG